MKMVITHANITLEGKYQLVEVVGQGSFGKIFRAVVEGSETMVAVKVETHEDTHMLNSHNQQTLTCCNSPSKIHFAVETAMDTTRRTTSCQDPFSNKKFPNQVFLKSSLRTTNINNNVYNIPL